VIEVDHLIKRYDSTVGVDDLSFVVSPGVITGFLVAAVVALKRRDT
jgi:ABC-2 type transport system ATP-binding protein